MIVLCKQCNKEMKKAPSVIKNGRGVFCSRSCRSKYWSRGENNPRYGVKLTEDTKEKISKKRLLQKPPTLGKKWKISKDKTKNMARGNWKKESNPAWIDGRSRKRGYSDKWTNKLRNEIRARDGYVCKICKKSGKEKISVHHINYNKKDNCQENLVSLCRACHSMTNFNRDRWIRFFEK